jgi:hypothetical protein
MVKKSKMGAGGRHVPVDATSKHSVIRVNLSPRQVMSLKKGGAITVKMLTDDGSHELTLPEMDIKKLLTKLNRGVGARVSLNGGSVESMFRDLGKYVQPLSDAAIDRGRRELGSGVESMFRDLGKYVQPLSDAAIDRGRRELGSGVESMFRDLGKYVQPLSDAAIDRGRRELGSGMRRKRGSGAFEDFFTKTLPSKLIHQGIPIAGQTIGSLAGTATGSPLIGFAGSQAGKYAGQKLAEKIGRDTGRGLMDVGVSIAKQVGKRVGKKLVSAAAAKAKQLAMKAIDTAESGAHEFIGEGIFPAGVSGGGIYPAGVNLRRGGGMADPIQQGSPYIAVNSPAFHPFKETYNPFATNSAVQRMPKSGGMMVRV